jgi:hypothetical protein
VCGRGVERTRAWVALRGATVPAGGEALRAIDCREELQVRVVGRGGSALENAFDRMRLAREKGGKNQALFRKFRFSRFSGVFLGKGQPLSEDCSLHCRSARFRDLMYGG